LFFLALEYIRRVNAGKKKGKIKTRTLKQGGGKRRKKNWKS